jgi:prepilin-type N-terminal cleavage/methylation domain-containing protein
MSTKRVNFLFYLRWLNSKKYKKNVGFTLIELLVALIIGSLIISSLLGLVVDILHADRDENAFNETQREMQIALNYISRELREAVYVYDGNCLTTAQGRAPSPNNAASEDYCPGLTNFLPRFNGTPILAFWKPEEIEDAGMPGRVDPTTGARTCAGVAAELLQECQDLLVKRRTYTLVVYLQSTETEGSRWSGKSRITRYALTKYRDSTRLERSPGYVVPYDREDRRTFQSWPIDSSTGRPLQQQPADVNNKPVVLVDFVDAPNADLRLDNITTPECPRDGYVRSPLPTAPAQNNSNSFYACVRRVIVGVIVPGALPPTTPELTNVNQDVILYLRGNAVGKQGIKNERNFRPTLQTQVLVRGVIDKNPQK